MVAEMHMGWSVRVFGALLDRVIAGVFPLGELRRHMSEEGRNLARLLAAGILHPVSLICHREVSG